MTTEDNVNHSIPNWLLPLLPGEKTLLSNLNNRLDTEFYEYANEIDVRNANPHQDNPNCIRSMLLSYVLHDSELIQSSNMNFTLTGAFILGRLNLESFNIAIHIKFIRCIISYGLNVAHSEIRALTFESCKIGSIIATNSIFKSDLLLRSCTINGTLMLTGARVEGNFILTRTNIRRPAGIAVFGNRTSIGGSLDASYLVSEGGVNLVGSKIGGDLSLQGSTIVSKEEIALNGDGSRIEGRVFLRDGFKAVGEVRFYAAKVGLFDMNRCFIKNSYSDSFSIPRCVVDGGISINDSNIEGKFNLRGAIITNGFSSNNTSITFVDELGIDGYAMDCRGGGIFLNNSTINGTIHLGRSKIIGNLELENAKIRGANSVSLNADGIQVDGFLLLRRGFESEGDIRLYGAKVQADLDLQDSKFQSLDASFASIGGGLLLRNLVAKPMRVSLAGVSVDVLRDDEQSWPLRTTLMLDGLRYARIDSASPRDSRSRLKWLNLQPEYHQQPYEHLIKILREMGLHQDASEVAIAKQRQLRKNQQISIFFRALNFLLDIFTGFGYKPWRPIIALIFVVMSGTILFSQANRLGVMCPTAATISVNPQHVDNCARPPHYPIFNPLVFSLESLIPIGDFRQFKLWEIRADHAYSIWVKLYFYVHILLGWLFAFLAALSPTKVLRRE